jgi:uncharacterized protein (TIGR04255 family)
MEQLARKNLAHPPLVEAIFEVQWPLSPDPATGLERDRNYALLPGRLSERLAQEYPAHEPLPAASVPGDLIPRQVQHRFRRAPGEWPLVQVGPGIATLNITENYNWVDFERRARDLNGALRDVYDDKASFQPSRVQLRYINAVPFDFSSGDTLHFLRERLKIHFALPQSLFDGVVSDKSVEVNWLTGFPAKKPDGQVTLRVGTGAYKGGKGIIWEIAVSSQQPSVPQADSIDRWLSAAHDTAEMWFFTLIAGELEREFTR